MRGQDDRKRERQARDGVSRPAGEDRPAVRGFPGSWHPAKRQVGKPPKPTEGGTDTIQSTNPTGFDHPAGGKADQVHYQKIRPSQGASRTVTIPAIIITMLDTTPSALPI